MTKKRSQWQDMTPAQRKDYYQRRKLRLVAMTDIQYRGHQIQQAAYKRKYRAAATQENKNDPAT
jgi:hypothetical protein